MIFTGLLTENWLFLIAYGVFIVLFFTIIEMRILCRHCPYYAREGRTIHCHANEGLPRLWKYDPKPLNKLEKLLFILCIIFLGVFPIVTEVYGIWWIYNDYARYGYFVALGLIGITITTTITLIVWLIGLRLFFCPNCVNFSCPLNRVPRNLVDAYLEKNPIMKKAWKERE